MSSSRQEGRDHRGLPERVRARDLPDAFRANAVRFHDAFENFLQELTRNNLNIPDTRQVVTSLRYLLRDVHFLIRHVTVNTSATPPYHSEELTFSDTETVRPRQSSDSATDSDSTMEETHLLPASQIQRQALSSGISNAGSTQLRRRSQSSSRGNIEPFSPLQGQAGSPSRANSEPHTPLQGQSGSPSRANSEPRTPLQGQSRSPSRANTEPRTPLQGQSGSPSHANSEPRTPLRGQSGSPSSGSHTPLQGPSSSLPDQEEDGDCPICKGSHRDSEISVLSECCHWIHSDCLLRYQKSNEINNRCLRRPQPLKCPLCKSIVQRYTRIRRGLQTSPLLRLENKSLSDMRRDVFCTPKTPSTYWREREDEELLRREEASLLEAYRPQRVEPDQARRQLFQDDEDDAAQDQPQDDLPFSDLKRFLLQEYARAATHVFPKYLPLPCNLEIACERINNTVTSCRNRAHIQLRVERDSTAESVAQNFLKAIKQLCMMGNGKCALHTKHNKVFDQFSKSLLERLPTLTPYQETGPQPSTSTSAMEVIEITDSPQPQPNTSRTDVQAPANVTIKFLEKMYRGANQAVFGVLPRVVRIRLTREEHVAQGFVLNDDHLVINIPGYEYTNLVVLVGKMLQIMKRAFQAIRDSGTRECPSIDQSFPSFYLEFIVAAHQNARSHLESVLYEEVQRRFFENRLPADAVAKDMADDRQYTVTPDLLILFLKRANPNNLQQCVRDFLLAVQAVYLRGYGSLTEQQRSDYNAFIEEAKEKAARAERNKYEWFAECLLDRDVGLLPEDGERDHDLNLQFLRSVYAEANSHLFDTLLPPVVHLQYVDDSTRFNLREGELIVGLLRSGNSVHLLDSLMEVLRNIYMQLTKCSSLPEIIEGKYARFMYRLRREALLLETSDSEEDDDEATLEDDANRRELVKAYAEANNAIFRNVLAPALKVVFYPRDQNLSSKVDVSTMRTLATFYTHRGDMSTLVKRLVMKMTLFYKKNFEMFRTLPGALPPDSHELRIRQTNFMKMYNTRFLNTSQVRH